jgi:hypothetical protein
VEFQLPSVENAETENPHCWTDVTASFSLRNGKGGNMHTVLALPVGIFHVKLRCCAVTCFVAGGSFLFAQAPQSAKPAFVSGPVHIQASVHAGYGFVSMQKLNEKIREVGTLRRAVSNETPPAKELTGGLSWDGAVMLRMNRLIVGVGGASLAISGNSEYNGSFYLLDNFDGKAYELYLLAGIRFPTEGNMFLDILAGGGYGTASMDYTGTYRDFMNPNNNQVFQHPLSGNYFAGRFTGIAGMAFGIVSVNLSVGYRIANAGLIKGKATLNGRTTTNEYPFTLANGEEIKFDFGGALLRGGITVEL